MRRRSRARSFLMWAAVAASGLLVGVWIISLGADVGTYSSNDGLGLSFYHGRCFVDYAASPCNDGRPRDWYFKTDREIGVPPERRLNFLWWGVYGTHTFVIPLWMPVIVSTGAGAFLWRSGRRLRVGHCHKCGYDLTGNVSGRCPECGCVAQSGKEGCV